MSEFVSVLSIRKNGAKQPDGTQIGSVTKTRALGLILI